MHLEWTTITYGKFYLKTYNMVDKKCKQGLCLQRLMLSLLWRSLLKFYRGVAAWSSTLNRVYLSTWQWSSTSSQQTIPVREVWYFRTFLIHARKLFQPMEVCYERRPRIYSQWRASWPHKRYYSKNHHDLFYQRKRTAAMKKREQEESKKRKKRTASYELS